MKKNITIQTLHNMNTEEEHIIKIYLIHCNSSSIIQPSLASAFHSPLLGKSPSTGSNSLSVLRNPFDYPHLLWHESTNLHLLLICNALFMVDLWLRAGHIWWTPSTGINNTFARCCSAQLLLYRTWESVDTCGRWSWGKLGMQMEMDIWGHKISRAKVLGLNNWSCCVNGDMYYCCLIIWRTFWKRAAEKINR